MQQLSFVARGEAERLEVLLQEALARVALLEAAVAQRDGLEAAVAQRDGLLEEAEFYQNELDQRIADLTARCAAAERERDMERSALVQLRSGAAGAANGCRVVISRLVQYVVVAVPGPPEAAWWDGGAGSWLCPPTPASVWDGGPEDGPALPAGVGGGDSGQQQQQRLQLLQQQQQHSAGSGARPAGGDWTGGEGRPVAGPGQMAGGGVAWPRGALHWRVAGLGCLPARWCDCAAVVDEWQQSERDGAATEVCEAELGAAGRRRQRVVRDSLGPAVGGSQPGGGGRVDPGLEMPQSGAVEGGRSVWPRAVGRRPRGLVLGRAGSPMGAAAADATEAELRAVERRRQRFFRAGQGLVGSGCPEIGGGRGGAAVGAPLCWDRQAFRSGHGPLLAGGVANGWLQLGDQLGGWDFEELEDWDYDEDRGSSGYDSLFTVLGSAEGASDDDGGGLVVLREEWRCWQASARGRAVRAGRARRLAAFAGWRELAARCLRPCGRRLLEAGPGPALGACWTGRGPAGGPAAAWTAV